jgi:hypothetical protein
MDNDYGWETVGSSSYSEESYDEENGFDPEAEYESDLFDSYSDDDDDEDDILD